MVLSLEQAIYSVLYKTKKLNVIDITNIIKDTNDTLYKILGNIPEAMVSANCSKLYKTQKLKRDTTMLPYIYYINYDNAPFNANLSATLLPIE